MKLLKNTRFAGAVAVIVCVLSMFIGTNKSLTSLAKDVENKFYSGVEADGYAHPSIASQLRACEDYALGLATIAKNYPELEDASDGLIKARGLQDGEIAVSEQSAANGYMVSRFDELYNLLGSVEMSERDHSAADAYAKDFYSAQTFIVQLAKEYNAEVVKYEKITGKFPVNIFGVVADTSYKF